MFNGLKSLSKFLKETEVPTVRVQTIKTLKA